jgi:hypothetical protein
MLINAVVKNEKLMILLKTMSIEKPLRCIVEGLGFLCKSLFVYFPNFR